MVQGQVPVGIERKEKLFLLWAVSADSWSANWRFKNREKDIQGSSRQSGCGEGMASGLLQRERVVCKDALQGNLECHADGAGLNSVYNRKSHLCAWQECPRVG